MGLWTALVLIVGLVIMGSVMRARYNAMGGFGTDQQGNPVGDPRREAELETEVRELRERVKVLERIATEDREARRLSTEIDKLRDE